MGHPSSSGCPHFPLFSPIQENFPCVPRSFYDSISGKKARKLGFRRQHHRSVCSRVKRNNAAREMDRADLIRGKIDVLSIDTLFAMLSRLNHAPKQRLRHRKHFLFTGKLQ